MRRTAAAVAGAIAAGLVLFGAACGDDDKDEAPGAAPPQQPGTGDGLSMEILSVTLPDGSSVRPVIRFRVSDANGRPVDLATEVQASTTRPAGIPNTVPRFTLAMRNEFDDFVSYYATTTAPRSYTPPAGRPTPPAAPASQATFQPPSSAPWPTGELKPLGDGTWEFTMAPIQVAGLDRTRPHTAAGWVVRTTAQGQDIAPASHDFVPAGGAAASRFETITDDGCNRCHGKVQAHGTRQGVQLCITCHSPQTSDPETSRTVDFKVMIHKIHAGAELPSSQTGEGYFIVGFGGSVHDYSRVAFPWQGGVRAACTVCHTGKDADAWKSRPTLATCTACHDNVRFRLSEATVSCADLPANQRAQPCLHDAGPIGVSDRNDPVSCAGCHGPDRINAIDRYHGPAFTP